MKIPLKTTTHRFTKSNLVTLVGRGGNHDTYRCQLCGLTGKRFGVDEYITVTGKRDQTICLKAPAPPAFGVQQVRVTDYTGFVEGDENLVRDSVHQVVAPPAQFAKTKPNGVAGVWVNNSHGNPILLLSGEFQTIENEENTMKKTTPETATATKTATKTAGTGNSKIKASKAILDASLPAAEKGTAKAPKAPRAAKAAKPATATAPAKAKAAKGDKQPAAGKKPKALPNGNGAAKPAASNPTDLAGEFDTASQAVQDFQERTVVYDDEARNQPAAAQTATEAGAFGNQPADFLDDAPAPANVPTLDDILAGDAAPTETGDKAAPPAESSEQKAAAALPPAETPVAEKTSKSKPTPAPAPEKPASDPPAAPNGDENASTLALFFADDEVAKIEPLTAEETADRERLETVAKLGFQSFVATGKALVEIRARHLFKSTHKSFAKYLVDVFGVQSSQGYKTMRAAGAAELVEGVTATVPDAATGKPKQLEAATPSIKTAADLDDLGKLLDTTDLSKKEIEAFKRVVEKAVWQMAIETAPVVGGKANVTQRHLHGVIETVKDIHRTKVMEIEGEQFDAKAAHLQITRERFEDMMRERQRIIDEIKARDERLNKTQELPAAQAAPVRDDQPALPEFRCALHGKTDLRGFKLIFAGFILSCGCKWRRVEGDDLPRYAGNTLTP